MSIPSIRQLRKTIQRRTDNLYDTFFTRRISVYITAILARVRVQPNTVSVVALLGGLGSCALVAFSSPPWIYLGVGLLHMHQILDSVDGELARLYQRPSLRGMFLEDLSAYLLINTYFLAFGVYLFRRDGDVFALGAAIVVVAAGRNAMPVVRRVILLVSHRARPPLGYGEEVAQKIDATSSSTLSSVRKLVEDHLLHYTNVRVALSSALVIEALTSAPRGMLRYLFFAYLALQMLKELGTIALYMRPGAIERDIATLVERSDEERNGGQEP